MSSASIPTAGLLRRLAAMFYDGLLLTALIILGTGAAVGLRVLVSGAEAAANDPETAVHGIFFQLYLLALAAAFFIYFWRKTGQTLGMQSWRLRVQNSDGSALTLRQCVLRLLGGVLSLLSLGLGWFVLAAPNIQRSLSDRLSNSEVVVLPKRKK